MPKYHYRGESLSEVLPAAIEEMTFEGVTISRLIGSEDQIKESTEIFCKLYPKEYFHMETMNDARYMGHAYMQVNGKREAIEIFELIVLRRKHHGS